MRGDGPAQGNVIVNRAIVETIWIGLTSADMPIPELLGDGWQSVFDSGDINKVMWNSTLSEMLTFDDNLRD